eukprot:COSAG01_NODE_1271_length_10961_cov_555.935739_4_plen_334_part_00
MRPRYGLDLQAALTVTTGGRVSVNSSAFDGSASIAVSGTTTSVFTLADCTLRGVTASGTVSGFTVDSTSMTLSHGTLSLRNGTLATNVAVTGAAAELTLADCTLRGVTASGTVSGFTVDWTSMTLSQGTLSLRNGTLGTTHVAVTGAVAALTLTNCILASSTQLSLSSGGRLSLASMQVHFSVFKLALSYLHPIGQPTVLGRAGTLSLQQVSVVERPSWGVQTGNITADATGALVPHPAGLHFTYVGQFLVTSGPCTTRDNDRCVGRPNGYSLSEHCDISVTSMGTLGSCPIFQVCAIPHTHIYIHTHILRLACATFSIAHPSCIGGGCDGTH